MNLKKLLDSGKSFIYIKNSSGYSMVLKIRNPVTACSQVAFVLRSVCPTVGAHLSILNGQIRFHEVVCPSIFIQQGAELIG